MGNQKVRQAAEEAVKEEIRKGNLIKSRDVLLILPELIDTICINTKKVRSTVAKSLDSNTLLSLFGITVVKRNKVIDSLVDSGADYEDVAIEIDDSYVKQWIALNPREFRTVMEKIAAKLYELEDQANQSYNEEKRRGDKWFDKYEKLTREYDEFKDNTDKTERLVAERIQYILSLNGKEAVSENEQLIELLKDMGISAYWDSNGAPMTEAAMFTDYAAEDEAMAGMRPCLVKGDSVYVKGIRLIKK